MLLALLQLSFWSGVTNSFFNNLPQYLRRITQPRMISGLEVNVLAGDVVTNILFVVITASAPNCWQNKSRDDAGLLLTVDEDINTIVQARIFDAQCIVYFRD